MKKRTWPAGISTSAQAEQGSIQQAVYSAVVFLFIIKENIQLGWSW
ncbi:hypothetical protein NXW94_30280 [Bacteroides ovatus]|nr:hypothetical protein [Bacteroides ovatus]